MLEANYDEVICPNCVTQFRAIPVNVQDQITALTTERDGLLALHTEQINYTVKIAAERDEWVAKHKECARLLGESMQDTTNVSIERDALALGVDQWRVDFHELRIERDAISEGWNTANKLALQNALERAALELRIGAMIVERSDAFFKVIQERDALKDAARLALDALVEIIAMNIQYCIDKYSDSSQAETMSCVITARKAISSLKKIL